VLFDGLKVQAPDALLALIGLFAADPRQDKIDLGVGVYRDESGATPVFRAVKAAEAKLAETQTSKSYLGPEGDVRFTELLQPIVFGGAVDTATLVGIQTPGGTGALRLAAELIAAARPKAQLWLGTPTWPNHAPIFSAAGLTLATYRYFDQAAQAIRFDEMMDALNKADADDIVLLHGCCHNPTGANLTPVQWASVAEVVARRGLIPLVDLAYQGLGAGLDDDAAGLRQVMDAAEDVIIAYSCDKNFGLYRDRVGALYVRAKQKARADLILSNMLALARPNWSMPPDHGAAVVRTILESAELAAEWRSELTSMRERIAAVRKALADGDSLLAPIAQQQGMFSLLPISGEQVAMLRKEHGIYMAGSGRANLAGLTLKTVPTFIEALKAVRYS
jgi:aromatic-amino-acid transaminase